LRLHSGHVFLSFDVGPAAGTRESRFGASSGRGPVADLDPKEEEMASPTCPTCGAEIDPPRGHPDSLAGKIDCPGCGRPLHWFIDDRIAGKWIIDETVEGQRRMAEGPGGLESPTSA
jgi:hypothetical protein